MNFSDKWKRSLNEVLAYYDNNKPRFWAFFPRLFLFFIAINLFCYWWATTTAFPDSIRNSFFYYFKVQFPVGILGAVFDSLSFFVTVFIIRRALKAMSTLRFVSHLSIDILIAVLATFWVLFVFSFSSWLVRLTEFDPTMAAELGSRQDVYRARMENAVEYPLQNKRNIYFGIVMGLSAILPTCLHFYLAIRSNLKTVPNWLLRLEKSMVNRVTRSFDKMNAKSASS